MTLLKIFKHKNIDCVKCPASDDNIDIGWCAFGCGLGKKIDEDTLNCRWFRFERALR